MSARCRASTDEALSGQALLACGVEGMPLDALTSARLARDGERPGPIRHMCSGQHSVYLLLARLQAGTHRTTGPMSTLRSRPTEAAVARAYTRRPARTAIDGCGLPTYAFPLRAVARAFAPWPILHRSRHRIHEARSRRRCSGSATRCWRTRWSAAATTGWTPR